MPQGATDMMRQVVRIDGDAVTTDPWSGVERLKAEGFGGGAANGVPEVDVHEVAELRHLVDQGDVDMGDRCSPTTSPSFCLAGPFGGYDRVAQQAVEVRRRQRWFRCESADHLGRVAERIAGVARVDTLRRKGQREVLPGAQPGSLQQRSNDLVRGPRVCCRFQDDEIARGKDRSHGAGRRFDR